MSMQQYNEDYNLKRRHLVEPENPLAIREYFGTSRVRSPE